MVRQIASDYGLNPEKETTLKLPKKPKSIKTFTAGFAANVRIFDGDKEHPFLMGNSRNNAVLEKGTELRLKVSKSIEEIVAEANITLAAESCKICEGGGWYSNGIRAFYKESYIEY